MNEKATHVAERPGFEELLLSDLVAVHGSPEISKRRRRMAVPLVAAAAAVVATVFLASSQLTADTQTAAAPKKHVFAASYISEALDSADDKILRISSVTTGQAPSRADTWWDKGRGDRYRIRFYEGDGTPVYDTAIVVEGTDPQTTGVDHKTKTWWVSDTSDQVKDRTKRLVPFDRAFKERIDEGGFKVVGREELEGRSVIHLTSDVVKPKIPNMKIELWVDETSYLPVRQISSDIYGNNTVSDYEWIPRTESNLRLLEPEVPGGFTLTDGPPPAPVHPDGTVG